MIGFCYLSHDFGAIIDNNVDNVTGYPLYSDPNKELCKNLVLLQQKVKFNNMAVFEETSL